MRSQLFNTTDPSGGTDQDKSMKLESARTPITTNHIIVLDIGRETSLLKRMAGEQMRVCKELPLGLDGLVLQCLRHEPPWPIELEHAIERTEETVMPLAPQFSGSHQLVLQGMSASLMVTALQACGIFQSVLTLNEVEALFNRLVAISQGRPSSQEKLSTDVRFFGALLIAQEFMHHLHIAVLTLTPNTSPISV
jgi:hypothetical protein